MLALLMLLSACSSSTVTDSGQTETDAAKETTTEAITETEEVRENVPEKNFGGVTFTFLTNTAGTKSTSIEHLVIEEMNGEVLNDALYERNRMLEDRFNVSFA